MSIAVKNENPFIFIHLPRTAGRSITQALESVVNEQYILKFIQSHPINIRYKNDDGSYEHEKRVVRQLGLDPPSISKPRSKEDESYAFLHSSLEDFSAALNSDLEEYYKFTVVRNPWDMTLSYYNYANHIRKLHEPFNEKRFAEESIALVTAHDQVKMVSLGGRIKLNKFIKFENLKQGFKETLVDLKLPQTALPDIRESSESVKDYRKFYNDESRKKVEDLFKEYIEVFNYEF
jgi:hypothetical protein